jgi:signal peptidase II
MRNLGPKLTLLGLLVFTVGCDRVTKHMASISLADGHSKSYLAETVRFEYAENSGAFLGLGANLPEWIRTGLFTIGTGVLLVAIAMFAWTHLAHTRAVFGLTLFAAGGLSNLFDRIRYGSVIDFMNVGVGPLRTGIFNVADLAILAGVIVFASSLRQT